MANRELTTTEGVATGAAGGALATLLTYPADVWITRQQGGTTKELLETIKQKGLLKPLYAGVGAKMVKNMAAMGVALGAVNMLKNQMTKKSSLRELGFEKTAASAKVIKEGLRNLRSKKIKMIRDYPKDHPHAVFKGLISGEYIPKDKLVVVSRTPGLGSNNFLMKMPFTPSDVFLHEFGHTLKGGIKGNVKKMERVANKNALDFIKKHESPEKLFGAYKSYTSVAKPRYELNNSPLAAPELEDIINLIRKRKPKNFRTP